MLHRNPDLLFTKTEECMRRQDFEGNCQNDIFVLFVMHRFCRIYVADKITWCNQYEYTY